MPQRLLVVFSFLFCAPARSSAGEFAESRLREILRPPEAPTLAHLPAIARRAKFYGVPIEFDIGASAMLPFQLEVARAASRLLLLERGPQLLAQGARR